MRETPFIGQALESKVFKKDELIGNCICKVYLSDAFNFDGLNEYQVLVTIKPKVPGFDPLWFFVVSKSGGITDYTPGGLGTIYCTDCMNWINLYMNPIWYRAGEEFRKNKNKFKIIY